MKKKKRDAPLGGTLSSNPPTDMMDKNYGRQKFWWNTQSYHNFLSCIFRPVSVSLFPTSPIFLASELDRPPPGSLSNALVEMDSLLPRGFSPPDWSADRAAKFHLAPWVASQMSVGSQIQVLQRKLNLQWVMVQNPLATLKQSFRMHEWSLTFKV